MVQSKSKGNQFENKILKQLKEIDPMAHKTLGSGNTKDDQGDIAFFNNLVECKHHKNISKSQIDNWWIKIVSEADEHRHNKHPLLVFKENHKPAMVMFWMHRKNGVRHLMYWDEFYNQLEYNHK